MKLARPSAYQSFVALFLLAIGLGTSGCSDSATVNPEVELASLTVSSASGPVALQPAFSSTTTQYSVKVPNNITSVTITARARVDGDTVSIDGQQTTSRSITVGQVGDPPTVVSIVVSESTSKSRTYTVALNRTPLAGNNDLSALSVTSGTLDPAFDANTTKYRVNVESSVASVTVTAAKADPNAVISDGVVAGAGIATGQANIQLGFPGTTTVVTIIVTAPNGSSKPYTIIVDREAPSSDNNLSALTVSAGTWKKPFAPGTLNYSVTVGPGVGTVTVTATKSDPNAVLSGSVADPGAGQAIGQATIPLGGPLTTTPVTITVTAPDGTPKTYTIGVFRTFLLFQ